MDLPFSRLWESVPQVVNELSRETIGIAIGVHEDLGPGLLEIPYKMVLAQRLRKAGHQVAVEHPLPLVVDGIAFDKVYVADLVIDDVLLLEIKCVERLSFPMVAQVKTYLRVGGYPLGLLLNFRPPRLHLGGIRRIVP